MDKLCDAHSGFAEEIKALKISDVRQWEAITKIQNRLPVWGTALISLLTFICGIVFTYATMK